LGISQHSIADSVTSRGSHSSRRMRPRPQRTVEVVKNGNTETLHGAILALLGTTYTAEQQDLLRDGDQLGAYVWLCLRDVQDAGLKAQLLRAAVRVVGELRHQYRPIFNLYFDDLGLRAPVPSSGLTPTCPAPPRVGAGRASPESPPVPSASRRRQTRAG
jgi:hypothetical protein